MKVNVKKIALTGLFLAVGTVLPFLTLQVKEIGDSLLPMHIPVMLAGVICGAQYGFSVGLILPFFRSVLFGMPPIYPTAVWMAAELATYGLIIGIFQNIIFKKKFPYIFLSLLISMVSGRIVWGIVKGIILGFGGSGFTFALFISGGFIDSFPGIIFQFILVPLILKLVEKATKSYKSKGQNLN